MYFFFIFMPFKGVFFITFLYYIFIFQIDIQKYGICVKYSFLLCLLQLIYFFTFLCICIFEIDIQNLYF